MNKTALKIGLRFTLTAAVIATLLLCINFLGFAAISSDPNRLINSPQRRLWTASEHLSYENGVVSLDDSVKISAEDWLILINEQGDIIWSLQKPNDIPDHYSLNDIASMTKWYLNDYPVYVETKDFGLLVLGTAKYSVGKYDIEYTMEWFDTLPQRLLTVLVMNLILAGVFAVLLGTSLFGRLREFTNGIGNLRQEKPVVLKEKGLFKELSKSINETSRSLERKNTALAAKEQARVNWIAGISHDIRTPLSIILGNAEALEAQEDMSEDGKARAGIIIKQSTRIKKLVEDLNLISSLEYDMQPAKRKEIRLCPLLRQIVTDMINSGQTENFEFILDLRDEQMKALIDEPLFERAIYNLLHNSVAHNPDGCRIELSAHMEAEQSMITIRDHGCGVPSEILEKITEMPKTAHGIGLPLAYKIITVHGGRMTAKNDGGFVVQIELPVVD